MMLPSNMESHSFHVASWGYRAHMGCFLKCFAGLSLVTSLWPWHMGQWQSTGLPVSAEMSPFGGSWCDAGSEAGPVHVPSRLVP